METTTAQNAGAGNHRDESIFADITSAEQALITLRDEVRKGSTQEHLLWMANCLCSQFKEPGLTGERVQTWAQNTIERGGLAET